MPKYIRATALVAVILAGALGLTVSSAKAATICDQTVYDGANLFSGSDVSNVQAAEDKMQSIGADVRVLTISNWGSSADLDHYIDSTEKSCSSWQSPAGGWKTNLIIFVVDKNDRKLGIFYGNAGRWANPLDANHTRIQGDYMSPAFKEGDWAGGFISAMTETQRVLSNYLHPKGNGGNTTIIKKKPAPWGLILGIIFGSILLIFFSVLVVRSARRRAEEKGKRRVAQQEAMRLRDAATTILQRLGDSSAMAVLKAKVAKYGEVGGTYADQLATALNDVETHYESATTAMQSAASASAKADDTDLTAGEYQEMAKRYQAILDDAQAAQKSSDEIDQLAAEIDAKHQQMSSDVPQVQSGIDEASAKVAGLKKDGIKTDPFERVLADGENQLKAAQANSADLSALQNLDQAKQALDSVEKDLQTLADQRKQLADGIPALNARISGVNKLIDGAKECFDRISGTYAESSWKPVAGNGTEALKRVDAAEKAVKQAEELSDVSQQDWEGALAALAQGNSLLDKATSLVQSITELEGHLHQAQQTAQAEIDAAQADIDKAKKYLHQYDDDIRDSLENDLAAAEQSLSEARTELKKDKPDFLKVVDMATKANSSADKIYDECVSEHEAAERLKRQAATTLQQAQAAVSQAEQYIEDHHGDVGSRARADLSDAQHALDTAQRAKEPAMVLKAAQTALECANDAYNEAEHNFRNAENRREEAREAAMAASIAATSHSSFDSDDFGGGSSSWGSFSGGGFGGGSSSFGGGGGGTGGGSSGF